MSSFASLTLPIAYQSGVTTNRYLTYSEQQLLVYDWQYTTTTLNVVEVDPIVNRCESKT